MKILPATALFLLTAFACPREILAQDPSSPQSPAPTIEEEDAYLAMAAGGEPIPERDRIWFREIFAKAENGDPRAQGLAAFALRRGRGTRRDLETARRLARLAHEGEDPIGTFNLAYLLYFESSDVVDRNKGKGLFPAASEGLESLAEEGDTIATAILGFYYLRGLDGKRDKNKARSLFRRAASAGERLGQFNLANLTDRGYIDSGPEGLDTFALMRRAALQGMPEAQLELGLTYQRGRAGLLPDAKRALQWILASAAQGYPRARAEILRQGIERSDVDLVKGAIDGKKDFLSGRPPGGGRDFVELAASRGNAEVLRLILEARADPDRRVGGSSYTALHAAVQADRLEAVRVLLEAGADPNAVDNHGNSPLSIALKRKQEKVADLLRKHGADLSLPDRKGRVALVRAAAGGDEKLVARLLGYGADPRVAEGEELTPCRAAWDKGKAKVIEVFRERGVECRPPFKKRKKGKPPQAAAQSDLSRPDSCTTGRCHGRLLKKVVVKHRPVEEDGCSPCHEGRASEHPEGEGKEFTLKGGSTRKLCFGCHRDLAASVEAAKHEHTAVREGRCTACHTPHGGRFNNLLAKFNPAYSEWGTITGVDKGTMVLCWDCHQKEIALEEETKTLTGFRNGELNLHFVHVNRKKGRTCSACHDTHAANQEFHIRKDVPFGSGGWKLPIEYTRTGTGGSCVVGCHRKQVYDRVSPVKLPEKPAAARPAKEAPKAGPPAGKVIPPPPRKGESAEVKGAMSTVPQTGGGRDRVDALITDLGDGSHVVRRNAAKDLGELDDGRAVDPLVKALFDSNAYVREAAAISLGRLGGPAQAADLRMALRDDVGYVHTAAYAALVTITKGSFEKVAALDEWPSLACITSGCHRPLTEGEEVHLPMLAEGCAPCHGESRGEHPGTDGPEFSSGRQDSQREFCFSCHRDLGSRVDADRHVHEPVEKGLCFRCHNLHGSKNRKLLKVFFPEEYYLEFRVENFNLCWECHDRSITLEETTEKGTGFRNGKRNLHFVHINQRKGRSCKACHGIHSGDGEFSIKNSRHFRPGWSLPILFTGTPTGGSCVVGCHRAMEYDRESPLRYR